MLSSESSKSVLLVLADCPGYFVPLAYRMAEKLRANGIQPIFAVTSPFYEKFKGISLQSLGPVYYLSEFLRQCPDDERVADVELDYWLAHATYIRTKYFRGRHVNDWDAYRKSVLFFRDLFDTYVGLSAVWSETPSNSTICIAHAEATKRDVPFLGYLSARIPNSYNVVLDRQASQLLANPNPLQYSPSPDDVPDYMKNTGASLASRSALDLMSGTPKKLWQALRARSDPSLETGETVGLQIRAIRRQLTRKLYYSYLVPKRYFSSPPSRDSSSINFLFPLHYRPEASTSVQAPFHESDLETIRVTAFSLPHNGYLYVREHPANIGNNRRAFFREVLSFPNVKLLDIDPPLPEIMDRFAALICLTGTSGFEAIQMGIPTFVLGRTFYEDYPGVTQIQSPQELAEKLSRFEAGTTIPTDEPMKRYLKKCFVGSFNYMQAAVLDPDNIENLIEPIRITLGMNSES